MLIVNALMQHCNAQFYASASVKVVTHLQTFRIEETPHKVFHSMFMIDINLYENFSKKKLEFFSYNENHVYNILENYSLSQK